MGKGGGGLGALKAVREGEMREKTEIVRVRAWVYPVCIFSFYIQCLIPF